jgi:hypothetical protein
MAYDLLSIPTISAETERTFSDTKYTISPTRTCLEANIIEAEECLHAWYKAGIWGGIWGGWKEGRRRG